jgi:glucose/arabinose dehydrogenase
MSIMVSMRFRLLALAAAVAGLAAAPAAAHAALGLQTVDTFSSPTYITSPPGDTHRLFVVERLDGTVRIVKDGTKLAQPYLTVPHLYTGGEGGLLSIAFDPDYAVNRRVYVYYTIDKRCVTQGCPIRVDEFRASKDNPDVVNPASQRKVIEIAHPTFSNHVGGQLQFGPDGFLYMGTGDGGNGNDEPAHNAENTQRLLGKLLRIDPHKSGDKPYSPATGNPFIGQDGKNEIYAYGLRNPWRFSFDRLTGDILIGDVGQGLWEELDYAPPGAIAGKNLGWRYCEGNHNTGTTDPCTLEGDADYLGPTFEYNQSGSPCAIMGGYVSRDLSTPALLGKYLYADLCVGNIHSVNPATGAGDADTGLPAGLISFGEDAQCRLYVAAGNTVSRITETPAGTTGCATS